MPNSSAGNNACDSIALLQTAEDTMRTRVCFTIDTEFSIAGAFTDAKRSPVAEPLVWCNVDGRSEGLGFMLETFKQYDIRATFFVETVHRHHFRHDPMRPIAKRIHAEGHEVQLHTHPCWALFQHDDWWERSRGQRRRDDFHGLDVAQSARLIQQGIDTFSEWGLPRPLVFRSGNLQHDDNLYLALKQTGIPYSSNVAMAISDCGNPDYKLYSGSHRRHGVVEFPVLTFSDWKVGGTQHTKSLTIAGSSFAETRSLLEKARAAGIAQVVILTHPFEYVHNQDLAYARTRRHSLTQSRLTRLCKYLHDNNDRFEAIGLAAAARDVQQEDSANTLLQGSVWQSLPRMAAQVAHDKYSRWMLKRTYGKKV
jgi:peptidoglycan/xylan/chitin deacetylase (PgdA/CDA1 family)